jgi:glutamate synthase (ferredoxin)
VLDSAKEVVAKGRLGPGQMVVADLDSGSFLRNEGVCEAAATDAAYDEWLQVLHTFPCFGL